jgi:hypothetical protein
MANINGEVKIRLTIRQDGSVESADVISGHPMLKQITLDSARQSLHECNNCGAPTPYSLTYTFVIRDDGDYCNGLSRAPKVTQSDGHITIVSAQTCICDPVAKIGRKVRSAKCLYLWRCGSSER